MSWILIQPANWTPPLGWRKQPDLAELERWFGLVAGFEAGLPQVNSFVAPIEEWTVNGTALTSLMDVERRHSE